MNRPKHEPLLNSKLDYLNTMRPNRTKTKCKTEQRATPNQNQNQEQQKKTQTIIEQQTKS